MVNSFNITKANLVLLLFIMILIVLFSHDCYSQEILWWKYYPNLVKDSTYIKNCIKLHDNYLLATFRKQWGGEITIVKYDTLLNELWHHKFPENTGWDVALAEINDTILVGIAPVIYYIDQKGNIIKGTRKDDIGSFDEIIPLSNDRLLLLGNNITIVDNKFKIKLFVDQAIFSPDYLDLIEDGPKKAHFLGDTLIVLCNYGYYLININTYDYEWKEPNYDYITNRYPNFRFTRNVIYYDEYFLTLTSTGTLDAHEAHLIWAKWSYDMDLLNYNYLETNFVFQILSVTSIEDNYCFISLDSYKSGLETQGIWFITDLLGNIIVESYQYYFLPKIIIHDKDSDYFFLSYTEFAKVRIDSKKDSKNYYENLPFTIAVDKTGFKITLSNEQFVYVKIDLINLKGQIVETIVNDYLFSSNETVKYEYPESLSDGIYFLRIKIEDKTQVYKLIHTD